MQRPIHCSISALVTFNGLLTTSCVEYRLLWSTISCKISSLKNDLKYSIYSRNTSCSHNSHWNSGTRVTSSGPADTQWGIADLLVERTVLGKFSSELLIYSLFISNTTVSMLSSHDSWDTCISHRSSMIGLNQFKYKQLCLKLFNILNIILCTKRNTQEIKSLNKVWQFMQNYSPSSLELI